MLVQMTIHVVLFFPGKQLSLETLIMSWGCSEGYRNVFYESGHGKIKQSPYFKI